MSAPSHRLARRARVAALATGVSLWVSAAHATYSIVGADTATRETGGAGTSCLRGGLDVYVIYGSAPGAGSVHAQAQYSDAGRVEAVRLLGLGAAPADIIAAITSAEFDVGSSVRQYGIVDAGGRRAGFTGDENGDYAGDRQGKALTFAYSVQLGEQSKRRPCARRCRARGLRLPPVATPVAARVLRSALGPGPLAPPPWSGEFVAPYIQPRHLSHASGTSPLSTMSPSAKG